MSSFFSFFLPLLFMYSLSLSTFPFSSPSFPASPSSSPLPPPYSPSLPPACLSFPSPQVSLNLHVKIPRSVSQYIESLNSQLLSATQFGQVDFNSTCQPHITLYLTDFLCSDISALMLSIHNLTSSVSSPLHSLPPICSILPLTTLTRNQTYSFYNVLSPWSCLQYMSDIIVNSTMLYSAPNQTVPSWIYGIENPIEREKKIEYVQRYGSPNVFDEFVPHITVIYDDNNSTGDYNVIDEILLNATETMGNQRDWPYLGGEITFGIGLTGQFGTVQRGKDLMEITIPIGKGKGMEVEMGVGEGKRRKQRGRHSDHHDHDNHIAMKSIFIEMRV